MLPVMVNRTTIKVVLIKLRIEGNSMISKI
jgi:hypothetical protein